MLNMNVTPFTEELKSDDPSNDSVCIPDLPKSTSSGVMTVLLMVCYVACFFIIVGGNGVVLFGLARFKVLRHPGNIFVGILSAVDMTLSVSLIMIMIQAFRPTLFQEKIYCQLRVSLAMGNLLASVFSLLGK